MRIVRGTVRFIHSHPFWHQFYKPGAPQAHRLTHVGEERFVDGIPLHIHDWMPKDLEEPSETPTEGVLRVMKRQGDEFVDA